MLAALENMENGGGCMKKAFFLGIFFAAICLLLGYFTPYHYLFGEITGVLGLVCLIIAGITSGAFISGDRNRGNFWTEDKESRAERVGIGTYSFLFGFPSFVVSLIIFSVFR